MVKRNPVANFFSKAYFWLIMAFLYLPIIVLVVFSFNSGKTMGKFQGFSLKWYKEMFADENIMSALLTTIVVALVSAAVSTVIGTLAAIGLSNSSRRLSKISTSLTYIPMINPDIVTGVALMLFFTLINVRMGYTTLILSHITFCLPYVIFSVMPRIAALNKDVYEAARDLGATRFYAYRKIIIPDIMPGIVSGFLLSVTLSIDDFMVSSFNTGNGIQNISIYAYTMTKQFVKPTMNALSTIMFAILILLVVGVNAGTLFKKKGETKNR